MKKLYQIVIIFGLLVLTSCQGSEENGETYEDVNVTLHVNPFNIYTEDFQKPVTASAAGVKSIVIAVYDNEGKEAYSATQSSTDDNYGNANFTLRAGTYSLVVIGYGNATAPTINSISEATIATPYLYDTFNASKTFTIGNTASETINMTLSRVVSCFRVAITDDLPSEAKTFVTIFSKGNSKKLNPSTGMSASDGGSTFTKNIPTSKICDAYTFLSTDDECMDITINIKDGNNETIASHTFPNVVLQRNRTTVAAGALFSSNFSSSFNFDNSWLTSTSIDW